MQTLLSDHFQAVLPTLTVLLETEYGLSSKLFSVGILSTQELDELSNCCRIDSTKASYVVDRMLCSHRNEDDYEKFLKALNESNQQHIVHCLKFQHNIGGLYFASFVNVSVFSPIEATLFDKCVA